MTITPQLIKDHELSPILANHYAAHAAFEQKVGALITRKITETVLYATEKNVTTVLHVTVQEKELKNKYKTLWNL